MLFVTVNHLVDIFLERRTQFKVLTNSFSVIQICIQMKIVGT